MQLLGVFMWGSPLLLIRREGGDYKEKTKEGELMMRCTEEVISFTLINRSELSFKITICDTPGFQDGINRDKEYLQKIDMLCNSAVHIIVYCTKIGEPMRECEERALGKNVLDRVVIALTFANQVQSAHSQNEVEYFRRHVDVKKKGLKQCFKKLWNEAIADQLLTRVYPVGSTNKLLLPTGNDWRVELMRGCLEACPEEGKGALFKYTWKERNTLKLSAAALVGTGGRLGTVGGFACLIAGALGTIGMPLVVGGAALTSVGLASATYGTAAVLHLAEKRREQEKEEKKKNS